MADKKEDKQMSVFETLNAIDVNDHTEQKGTGNYSLTYLSWAWAWAEVKTHYPEAFYTIYENVNGWNYHTDGRTAWVKTGVTIEGLEHIEFLPVMDNRNQSILLDKLTSFDVNKAIQRSLTKAGARHGLGLYIYAGEDLPESAKPQIEYADKKDVELLESMLKDVGSSPAKFLKKNKLESMDKIPVEKYVEVLKILGDAIEKLNEEKDKEQEAQPVDMGAMLENMANGTQDEVMTMDEFLEEVGKIEE